MSAASLLKHYFFPHESNNHKSKLLHPSSLILLISFFVLYQIILSLLPVFGPKVLGFAANIPPLEIVRLTNERRLASGVHALRYSPVLAQAAYNKGLDMLQKDYWAHVAPDGTQPWKFFVDVGYRYRFAGENLARDFSNPASAIEAWMASPTHRENMLSGKYTEIGVAVVEGDLAGIDTTLIVQFFGSGFVQTPVATTPTSTAGMSSVTNQSLAQVQEAQESAAQPVLQQVEVEIPPEVLVSPFSITRGLSVGVVMAMLVVLMIDVVVVSKRKITRISGRPLAHLSFLGMILAVVLVLKVGQVL